MNVATALRQWRTRDRSPLQRALTPPCDCLGDEIYDVALAVVFRKIAEADSIIERIGIIEITIAANRPQLAHIRSIDREYQPEAHDAGDRIERMLDVLEQWKNTILDDAGRSAAGRAA